MKLYYDNLYSFMPNSTIVDGKQVLNPKMDAARKAMILLSNFQLSGNPNTLYEAVFQISQYAEVAITDLVMSLGDVEIDETAKTDDLLNIAAKNLFKTITPDFDIKDFDYKYFAAILLFVAHQIVLQNSFQAITIPKEEVIDDTEDASPQ